MNARKISNTTLLIGVIATFALMGYMAVTSPTDAKIAMLGFLAWALLPYAALYLAARRAKEGRWANFVALATVVITGLALAAFVFGFFVRPDPQSGLMFVVLPLYQLLVAVPLLIATFVVTRRR